MTTILPKQQRFLDFFLHTTLSATEAAVRAGYTPNRQSAKVVARRLLDWYPAIRAELIRHVSELTGQDVYGHEEAIKEIRRRKRALKEIQRAFPHVNF